MPLLAAPDDGGQVTAPEGFPKIPVPPGKRIVWVSPGGTELELTGGTYTGVTGRSGFGPPAPDLVVDRAVSGLGRVRDVRVTPRVMMVPLVVHAQNRDAYLAARRELVWATTHHRGGSVVPGQIRVELPDGSWRQIAAYYQGGLAGSEDELDDLIWSRQEYPDLEFYAPDPFFRGPGLSRRWQIAVAAAPFFPIYPIQVVPSQLGGSATVTNPGDGPAYPVWEVTGPGTPVVTNTDTGEAWGFSTSISAGETVTVDCRPPDVAPESGLTAVDTTGADWWPDFAGFPTLWHLPPGETSLQIQMDGATEATRVGVTYEPRYRAGW